MSRAAKRLSVGGLVILAGWLVVPWAAGAPRVRRSAAVAAGRGDEASRWVVRGRDVEVSFRSPPVSPGAGSRHGEVTCGDDATSGSATAANELPGVLWASDVAARVTLSAGQRRLHVRFRRDLARRINACVLLLGDAEWDAQLHLIRGRRFGCRVVPPERVLAANSFGVLTHVPTASVTGLVGGEGEAWRICRGSGGSPFAVAAAGLASDGGNAVEGVRMAGPWVTWWTPGGNKYDPQFPPTRIYLLDIRGSLERPLAVDASQGLPPASPVGALVLANSGTLAWTANWSSSQELDVKISGQPPRTIATDLGGSITGVRISADGHQLMWTQRGTPRTQQLTP